MKTLALAFVVSGLMALVMPLVSRADPVGWYEGRDRLNRQLQPGKTPAEYRLMLHDMGYTVTSDLSYTITPQSSTFPSYIEYEVVKGDRSYEVRLDLNERTGRATKVEIADNIWQAPRTEAIVEHNARMASLTDPNTLFVVTPYSVDRDERTALEQMARTLEQLPVGRSKESYHIVLPERGYDILRSTTTDNTSRFLVRRNGREALVNVRFDPRTGRSTHVTALPFLQRTTAQQTTNTPERDQPTRQSTAVPRQ